MSHPLDNFIFFGSSTFSIVVLEELKSAGFLPKLIVTTPAERSGRKMLMHEPAVKTWGSRHNIAIIQPERLNEDAGQNIAEMTAECFVVASYGKIIPKKILNLSTLGAFNIHPSLLPKYRGPSPIQSQILAGEKELGVAVIKMDERVDHGPILARSPFENTADLPFLALGTELFKIGTKLLIDALPRLKNNKVILEPQDESQATFTKKFEKSDGEIQLQNGREAWLRFLALSHSPGVYFVYKGITKNIRLKVTAAEFKDGQFVPLRVIPEAKREMTWPDFLRGQNQR